MTENEDIARLWEKSLHRQQAAKDYKEESYKPPPRVPDDPEMALLAPEKRKVIETLHKLKLKTTPPELAAASGLSINQSSFWLNKIAGETGGKLEVAADGTIHYTFKRNFTNAYLQRGIARTALVVGTFLFQVLYWIVRVSFGVALVLSIVIVIALIVLVIVAAMSGSNDSGGGGGGDSGGGGGGLDFFDFNFLRDIFIWDYSPSRTYYPNSYSTPRKDNYSHFSDDHPKGNFFLDCFSFLFGDGAPNERLQEVRWNQIARVIRENGGVISTEQVAPFLDGDRSDSGMILGALAQFNGRPEVTKSGYIVYVFPDYLKRPPARERDMSFLQEDEWRFTGASAGSITAVLAIAIANFAGSWWLFKHIATINLLHSFAALIDVLLTYAIIFLLIPLVRYFVLQVLNQRIKARNKKREDAYMLLQSRDEDVMQELEEAKEVRRQEIAALHDLGDQIIYSSDRDSVEQQFDQYQNLPQNSQTEEPGENIELPKQNHGLRNQFKRRSSEP